MKHRPADRDCARAGAAPIALHPIAAHDLEHFLGCFRERYVAERMAADHVSHDAATRFVAAQWAEVLPDGAHTPGHALMWAIEAATDVRIGLLWLNVDVAERQAYIYQIEVFEAARSRGLGQAVLRAAEAHAASMGARTIRLNVFTPNLAAIRLYESAGYRAVSQHMDKWLT